MFGGSTNPSKDKVDPLSSASATGVATTPKNNIEDSVSSRDDKVVSLVESPKRTSDKWNQIAEKKKKKRRSSSTAKAAALFASAKNTLHLSSSKENTKEQAVETPIQALGKMDPALNVPQGSLNNSAGESLPTSRSTFRVGVTEDKNKKCRRTMEDTHAYLYHFLGTPIALKQTDQPSQTDQQSGEAVASIEAQEGPRQVAETDNGYFAIFDGHAGTFAAEWCGKKLHLILEESIRKNPKAPVPMLLDHTFTSVDQQLENLPVRNSGCTAVTAVLRWEDRTASSLPPAIETTSKKSPDSDPERESISKVSSPESLNISRQVSVSNSEDPNPTVRSRVLYTANVGDARIILCRNGKALRLSYDHKGSDENEGIRITNAGGLILNNRVNGVLAVTRALGDSYMKDLVTGHPFTTETIIQPETDEFLILACDGLWDVCSDQEAVDLVRNTQDPQAASKILVDYALSRFSTDNLSCMIVRFDKQATSDRNSKPAEPNPEQTTTGTAVISETESIVETAKRNTERESRDSAESKNHKDMSPAEDTAQADSKSDQEPGPEISTPNESKNLAAVSETNVQQNSNPASDEKKPL